MSSKENGEKKAHGTNAEIAMNRAIEDLARDGVIVSFEKKRHYGYEGYDQKQFTAHEYIQFCDGTKAILFSTASLSTDRVAAHQWSASNIKKIDSSVEYAFLVLPDSKAAKSRSTSSVRNIREHKFVTALDDILTINELRNIGLEKYSSALGYGRDNDYRGRAFEDVVAEALGNADNLARFNGDSTCVGYFFDIFDTVFLHLGIKKDMVKKVSSTTAIPFLNSGGPPKTDVVINVVFVDDHSESFTFSLKSTSQKAVAVHEYSANDFCEVLDPNNLELRRLLNCFQAAGCMGGLSEEDQAALTDELTPYHEKLDRWVLGGHGAPGASDLQCADYLIVHNKQTDEIAVHTLNDYIERLETNNNSKTGFGTIFSWTYPSGKRGKKIKLKCTIQL